jgi:hypothetical protein
MIRVKSHISHAAAQDDFNRFGVCIWNKGTVRPKTYALYNIAGVDLYDIKLRLERVKTWSLNRRSQFLRIVDRVP